jgi:tripeptide aminopeptidase
MLTPDGSVEQLFCELVAIPSPSGRERAVSDAVAAWLAGAGVPASLDGTGESNDSDAGNLIATVGGAPGALSLLFVAHLDTVESGTPAIEPVLGEDGVIRSSGETILGADNKSAVAAVMRACAFAAKLDPARRPTVRGAFTCREEAGRMGVSLLGLDGVDCAFSVDGSAPIGTTITRALGQQVFTIVVSGRTAHAAASPQDGVSAIAVAARAVAAMELGRLPGGGSASIAAVVAGAVIDHLDGPGRDGARAALERTPTNSVPDLALLRGEVRGYSEEEIVSARAMMRDAIAEACAVAGATFEWIDRERGVPPFPGVPDSRALALARAACAATDGTHFSATHAHATLEANYLAARTDVVALASGGRDAHQPSESITVGELRALEALLSAIVREAAPAAVASSSSSVSGCGR